MEDVEVGHCCGDAVELVHQRRLYIVEEFGAHDAIGLGRFAFPKHHKKNRETFCLKSRFWTTCITNEKAHGKHREHFCLLV